MNKNIKLIQSLQRAFMIIDCFKYPSQSLSINEISTLVDLNINTTRGLVQTLVYFNYLRHDEESNLYQLGTVFIGKYRVARMSKINDIITEIKIDMQILANKTKSTIRFIFIENFSISNILIINPTTTRYYLATNENTKLPLYASASGKLLLYHLDDKTRMNILDTLELKKYTDFTLITKENINNDLVYIKNRGYSEEINELEYGISSIAIPILKNNELLFTLSATSNSILIDKNKEDIIRGLIELKSKIEFML